MQQQYKSIDDTVLQAVAALYRDNDRITLQNSRINDEDVPWHVYSAICERIKYNADLHGDRSKPGAVSQVLLRIDGEQKQFAVRVAADGGLELTAQREGALA